MDVTLVKKAGLSKFALAVAFVLLAVVPAMGLYPQCALASEKSEDGLPVPRFVSLRSGM